MNGQHHYERIAKAIEYLVDNYKSQPDLDTLAEQVYLSPFHFQRTFTEWAGVSPKKFLQFLTLSHAKEQLLQGSKSLFDTAIDAGLSGAGRLHDLFISIEGMTPGEYRQGGEHLDICFQFLHTRFGRALAAATPKGICFLDFPSSPEAGIDGLRRTFPNAEISEAHHRELEPVLQLLGHPGQAYPAIRLHVKGSGFQLKVWEALLRIPAGSVMSYGMIAREIGQSSASRAVGTAVAGNPVAYLIPCHRVIQASGALGHYHWGPARKAAMIGWEAAQADLQPAR